MASHLARCPEPGCPVRFTAGADRLCLAHTDDDDAKLARAAAALGLDLARARSALREPARCTVRSCPVRYTSGPDRPCQLHAQAAATLEAARLEAAMKGGSDGD